MSRSLFPDLFKNLVEDVRVARNGQKEARTDVLLISYTRSGSSVLGRLLGFRNDTFYVNEPLWKLHKWEFLTAEQPDTLCAILTPDCKSR